MTTVQFHTATAYANQLLESLGERQRCATIAEPHPALRYAQSGLLALTGTIDAPQILPLPLVSCADGVIAALRVIAGADAVDNEKVLADIDGAVLLGERAALASYTRAGAISAGGSCRLLATSDGWLALNLTRPDDWDLLPAWLNDESNNATDYGDDTEQNWLVVAALLKQQRLSDCIERGRLLGLAVAPLKNSDNKIYSWRDVVYENNSSIAATSQQNLTNNLTESALNKNISNDSFLKRSVSAENILKKNDAPYRPLVIDLSSLWAGPLCTHLLQQLGARVIKVESMQRPDGARAGVADFYNLLNADKESVVLDFSTPAGRVQLRALCERADIVIEASRPRALRQLGIVAEDIIAFNPSLTWISITGYGRREPEANWIAFGDDAAVAAQLSHYLFEASGEMLFCSDAIADPLTGLHAALAAWHSYKNGGGRLIALALRDVVGYCLQFSAAAAGLVVDDSHSDEHTSDKSVSDKSSGDKFDTNNINANRSPFSNNTAKLRELACEWRAIIERAGLSDVLPSARTPTRVARALGSDTLSVLTELNIPC